MILLIRKLYDRFAPVDKQTVDFMESIPANDEIYVEYKELTKSDLRRVAQNRLYWAWITDMSNTLINEHAGNDKSWWHFEMKKRYLVPIYERDNESYAITIETIRKVYRQGMKQESQELFKFIVKETSTTDAKIKQFTEYLTEIQRFCDYAGIRLRTDDRFYDEAFGR
jgi:hypothetical protein